jgi:ribosome-associated protein
VSVSDEGRLIAQTAAAVADDRKAENTIILDVSDVIVIAEAFVVTSASNRRLVRAVAESVEEIVRSEHQRSPLRTEGLRDLEWVLLDYGDVVVHVFGEETRRYYEIERLYRDVARLDWEPRSYVTG